MQILGFRIELVERRTPKHLKNRTVEQLRLRRDIANLCSERKGEMSYKEMEEVIKDVGKSLVKLRKKERG